MHYQAHFREITSNVPAQACIWAYTVLLATRTFNPIGKDSSPITSQYSPAVTHCILAAPQFTYPKGMEGWVNLSAPGIEPGPYCVVSLVGGRSTHWASQTDNNSRDNNMNQEGTSMHLATQRWGKHYYYYYLVSFSVLTSVCTSPNCGLRSRRSSEKPKKNRLLKSWRNTEKGSETWLLTFGSLYCWWVLGGLFHSLQCRFGVSDHSRQCLFIFKLRS